ncbi:MAG: glycerophosphodiester phosphodiesterase [Thermomicrobiales bacterium]
MDAHVGYRLPPALRGRLRAGQWLRTAHRGLPYVAPGNTTSAIAAAADLGVDVIEIDLHATADGRLVLWHDEEIPAPGQAVTIATATLHKLRQLDLGQGERIIELADAMAIARDRAALMIDLKANGLARPIAETARRLDFAPLIVCGHFWGSMRWLRRHVPEIGISFTLDRPWRRRIGQALIDRSADAVTVNRRMIDRALISHYHNRGIAVLAWTVDDPAEMQRLLDLGVDGLTSNRPDLFPTIATPRAQLIDPDLVRLGAPALD